jgi:hypothetical protein
MDGPAALFVEAYGSEHQADAAIPPVKVDAGQFTRTIGVIFSD